MPEGTNVAASRVAESAGAAESASLLDQIVEEGRFREPAAKERGKDIIKEFISQVLQGEVTVSKDTEAMINARIAQIDHLIVRHLDPAGGKVVADKEFIDDELDLLGVQVDVSAPPAFEFEVSLGLGVDLGIDVILLGPQRVRGILALEVLHKPGAIELAAAEIAGERSQPAST